METLYYPLVEDLQVALNMALFRLVKDSPVAEVLQVVHGISATYDLPTLFHVISKDLSEPNKPLDFHPLVMSHAGDQEPSLVSPTNIFSVEAGAWGYILIAAIALVLAFFILAGTAAAFMSYDAKKMTENYSRFIQSI